VNDFGAQQRLAANWGRAGRDLIADLWHEFAMIRYQEAAERAIAESAGFSIGRDFARYQRGVESGAVRALRAEQWMRWDW
jgi:hypothetical protein